MQISRGFQRDPCRFPGGSSGTPVDFQGFQRNPCNFGLPRPPSRWDSPANSSLRPNWHLGPHGHQGPPVEKSRVKFNIGVRFGGLTEKTPFLYRYFEVLGQKISCQLFYTQHFSIAVRFCTVCTPEQYYPHQYKSMS